MKLAEIRNSVWNLLIEPTPVRLEKFAASFNAPPAKFSIFEEEGARAAAEVYDEFFRIADQPTNPDLPQESAREYALTAVLSYYRYLEQGVDPELLNYALMVFITHHPYGNYLSIPSIVLREPEKIVPSQTNDKTFTSTAEAPEVQLNWFR